jgi:hypothetical protein
MAEENEIIEHSIPSLDNFPNLDPAIREKEENLAESLAASLLVYEEKVSLTHDFFIGNYAAFSNSLCFAKLQNLELQKIKQNFQIPSKLNITAEDLHKTTFSQLKEKFGENTVECTLVFREKARLKKQISRKLSAKIKSFKEQWVRSESFK